VFNEIVDLANIVPANRLSDVVTILKSYISLMEENLDEDTDK